MKRNRKLISETSERHIQDLSEDYMGNSRSRVSAAMELKNKLGFGGSYDE